MGRFRLQTKKTWADFVAQVERAPASSLQEALSAIRDRAVARLREGGWEGAGEAQRAVEQGRGAALFFKSEAEEMDNRYLNSLEEADEQPNPQVMREFAIARALTALASSYEPDAVVAVLESAYELSVISQDEDPQLRAMLGDVVQGRVEPAP